MEPKYQLVKVLVAESNEPTLKMRKATPIIGYVLKFLPTGDLEAFGKMMACHLVKHYGATNVEAKQREFKGETIDYLKPTDGKKINTYMINVGE